MQWLPVAPERKETEWQEASGKGQKAEMQRLHSKVKKRKGVAFANKKKDCNYA